MPITTSVPLPTARPCLNLGLLADKAAKVELRDQLKAEGAL